jgi:hypothetical protein
MPEIKNTITERRKVFEGFIGRLERISDLEDSQI